MLVVVFGVYIYNGIGPSPDCGSPATEFPRPNTTQVRTLISGGLERCYIVNLPPDFDPQQPTALVVTLHGLANNGAGIRSISNWDALADQKNFVGVYPDSTLFPLRWGADERFNVEVDDVQFFRDLVADISGWMAVDPDRIYVNGFSNGAAMTALPACEAADILAGAALVDPVGSFMRPLIEGCAPERPLPVMLIAGMGDAGGLDRDDPSVKPFTGWLMNLSTEPFTPLLPEDWGDYWADLNDCVAPGKHLPA